MKINAHYLPIRLLTFGMPLFVLLGSGCVSPPPNSAPSNNSTCQQVSPNNQSSAQKDPLSYGTVTSKVKKGETTQEEIVQLFGAPNITTVNTSGEEVWVYDRISSASEQNGSSEAGRFGSFFGLDRVIGKEATGQATAHASSTQTSTFSSRTLTVIVNFDLAKKVRDYSARATQF